MQKRNDAGKNINFEYFGCKLSFMLAFLAKDSPAQKKTLLAQPGFNPHILNYFRSKACQCAADIYCGT